MEGNQGYAVSIFDHGTDSCKSIATTLTQTGYVTEWVDNLEEAKEKLEVRPGILFLHLPDEAFDKWLEKGKRFLNNIEAPVIFTVDTMDDERFQAIRNCNRYGFLHTGSNPYNVLQTIGYAIKLFEMRHFEQQKVELNTLATSFSAATGKQLFDNICRHLVELLKVDCAFIGEVIDQNERIKIHSIFEGNDFGDPFEYSLEDTPCQNLLENDVCVFKSEIRKDFPNDERLEQWGAEGYIGVPLLSSSGKPLGIAVLLCKTPIKNEEQCKQYLQIYSDRVSAEMERLHAEAELRNREEELRSINEHISEGIYRSTPKDGLIYVNEAFATMFGYDSPQELLNLGAKLYANEERRNELTEIENSYGYIKNEEVEFQRKDGSTFWGLMSGQVVRGEDGEIKYYDGSVLDITERKFAIEENRRLLKAIQQSPVSIIITDAQGYIEYVNPRFLGETGLREEELMGNLAPMLERNELTESFYEEMWTVIRSGEIWSRTIQKAHNDHKATWEKVTISPVFADSGEITNYVIIHNDITERKARENKLQQSLSEKEILLAEIHHRVKNNLAIISGLLDLAAHKKGPAEVNIFHESQMRIQSMAMVHEKLYQAGNFTNLKMENYVAELVESIRDTLIHEQKDIDINIENEVEAQLNINQAIPCALMINELVTNAFKYAYSDRESGKLDIRLQSKGDNVCLIVEDDGPGLPENFEEYEDPDSLGFVLIRQLTKQLEGKLEVKNGDGARFEILFERSDRAGSSSAGYIIDRRK